MRRSPRKAKRSLELPTSMTTPNKSRRVVDGQFDDAEETIEGFRLDRTPSTKGQIGTSSSKSPGSFSNSSVDSMESDGPEPLELPSFTPSVKCALREATCEDGVWNMVSACVYTF